MNENENEVQSTQVEPAERRSAIPCGIQMPAQQVRTAIKSAVALDRVSEEDGEMIYWLYSYAKEFNLGYKELSKKMEGTVGDNTIYQVFHGSYSAARWDGIIREIKVFHKAVMEEMKRKDIGFVRTDVSRIIFQVCQTAMNDHMPAFIYGPSQIGKTTALLEFQRLNNHGRTKYLRMGSHWTKTRFVRELALVCNAGGRWRKSWEIEDAIYGALNRYNLLIVDEFHLAIETTGDNASKEIMEFIREVYDRTGCGLVMSSTKVGLEGLEQGKNKMIFDQLRRRGIVKVVLPDVPGVADINAFAKSFELPRPTGETLAGIKRLIRVRGQGVFVNYLQMAFKLANEDKKPLTWGGFEEVCAGYAQLADMKAEW